MKLETITPGKYVVAVSGGVDSMVLLALLAGRPGLELVVAHFDHGIRPDSAADRKLVEKTARRYGLPFVAGQGHLGTGASEAVARKARYAFLRHVMAERGAQAIITAHHRDDLLETVIINIIRGTGRKGLSSLGSGSGIIRPMLHTTKAQIREYTREYPDIMWREDSTNHDDRYLRNYIRRHVTAAMDGPVREQLLAYAARAGATNPVIDALVSHDIVAHTSSEGLDRRWFAMLPYDISCEVMAAWLRQHGVADFDRRLIGNLVIHAKTAAPGKRRDINAGYLLKAGKTALGIMPRSGS